MVSKSWSEIQSVLRSARGGDILKNGHSMSNTGPPCFPGAHRLSVRMDFLDSGRVGRQAARRRLASARGDHDGRGAGRRHFLKDAGRKTHPDRCGPRRPPRRPALPEIPADQTHRLHGPQPPPRRSHRRRHLAPQRLPAYREFGARVLRGRGNSGQRQESSDAGIQEPPRGNQIPRDFLPPAPHGRKTQLGSGPQSDRAPSRRAQIRERQR